MTDSQFLDKVLEWADKRELQTVLAPEFIPWDLMQFVGFVSDNNTEYFLSEICPPNPN